MTRPILDRVNGGGGVYPDHKAAVVSRIGEGQEHAWLEIVECLEEPSVVGRKYRMMIAGCPIWIKGLSAEDLAIARQAPHISETLAAKQAARRKSSTPAKAGDEWDPFAAPPPPADPFAAAEAAFDRGEL